MGQTQECGIEGGKSQPPGTGLAWSGPPLEGLVFGLTDLALPHPTWELERLVLCAGTLSLNSKQCLLTVNTCRVQIGVEGCLP